MEEILKSKKIVIKPTVSPLGNYISEIIIKTLPFWNSIGVFPNILTTIGIFSSIAFIYYTYHKNMYASILFLILRCYFDYADGLFARKYNKTSKFGAYYDQISDICFFGIPLILVIYYSNLSILLIPFLILILFSILININIEEKYEKKTGNGGNLLYWTFIKTPIFFNKYYDEIYSYFGYVILIIIFCKYK